MSDEELLAWAKECQAARAELDAATAAQDALIERHRKEQEAAKQARAEAYDRWFSARERFTA